MKSIPFTQYLRPNGRKVEVSVERPDEVVRMAQQIIDKGYCFECEHLTTGQVSLTIADHRIGEDVAIRLASNGPEVLEAVDGMVRAFHAKLYGESR